MKYGEMSIEEVAENSVDMIIAAVDTVSLFVYISQLFMEFPQCVPLSLEP